MRHVYHCDSCGLQKNFEREGIPGIFSSYNTDDHPLDICKRQVMGGALMSQTFSI